MSLFTNIFKKRQNNSSAIKHNECEAEISQYSNLPRYYYIQGKKYDIDSPDSVNLIPICETNFNINENSWAMDAILREHVNRNYYKIPDALKESCYQKISELNDGGFKTESVTEKNSRLEQEKKRKRKSKG